MSSNREYVTEKFIEIWSRDAEKSCTLPPLPVLTYGHTQDGDHICGGHRESFSMKSCYVWSEGKWETKVDLLRARFGHVSWRTDSGLRLLGGEGRDSRKSSELIKDGVSQISFPLEYRVVFSCAVREG